MLSRTRRAVLGIFPDDGGGGAGEGEEEKRRNENGREYARERVVLSLGLDMNNRGTHSREGMVFGEVTVLLAAGERKNARGEEIRERREKLQEK